MQKVIQFFREVQEQFKNISWPKKDTLIQLTVVVIVMSVAISSILGGLDFIFTNGIGLLTNLKNQPQQTLTLPPSDLSPTPEISITPANTAKPSPNSKK